MRRAGPFGAGAVRGALIYVPSEWIRPAEGGVYRLMNVYVSMGVTPPLAMPSVFDVAPQPAKAGEKAEKAQISHCGLGILPQRWLVSAIVGPSATWLCLPYPSWSYQQGSLTKEMRS